MATNDPRVNLFDAVMADKEARKIAAEFSRVLREWLTANEMGQVLDRNKNGPEYVGDMCCASQDFCDANMAMDEALRNLYGATWDTALNDGSFFEETSRFHPLWNRAWSIAKASEFNINQ